MVGTNLLIWCIIGVILNSVPWVRTALVQYPQSVCSTESCQRTAQQIINKMDQDVDPCENFYMFSCGKFLKESILPDNKNMINPMVLKEKRVKEEIKLSLEEESPPDELNAFKLAKKFYKTCMNIDAIEAKGLNPLRDMMQKLGGWPMVEGDNWAEENFTWTETIYRINDANYISNHLITTGLGSDGNNIIMLSLTPPEPTATGMDQRLTVYANWTMKVAVLLGANEDRAMKEMLEIVSFETSLLDYHYNATPMAITVEELIKLYPTIAWKEFLQRQLPANITIDENERILINPNYISHLEKVMNQTPKRVQANYLMHGLTIDLANFMSQISEIENLVRNWTGEVAHWERWRECLNHVLSFMPTSVVGLYVRKYYEKDTKQKATELTEDLKRQLRILLQNSDWMDDDTRQHALDKIDAMGSRIAYPEELLDDVILEESYEGLVIDEEDFYQSLYNLVGLKKKNAFKDFRGPASNVSYYYNELVGYGDFFNAQYWPDSNLIDIPFGFLQMIVDTKDVPKYVNYANLGFFIGHEIAHGFDNNGIYYGKNGEFGYWWTNASTEKQFFLKMQCLIEQYNNYSVDELGIYVNGSRTLMENIADNVAIRIAYMAYKDWVQRDGSELGLAELPYTQNQIFWLTYASFWCSVERKAWTYELITEDPHAPNEFRIIGTLSNMPEFAKDFSCPANSKMNPENKCTLW